MESLITFQGFHQATVDGVRPEADHLTSDVISLSTLALVLQYMYRFSVQANTIGVKPEAKDLETDQSGLLEGIS
jgi:multisubunit Na+/H+ antiporter MnhC subunit